MTDVPFEPDTGDTDEPVRELAGLREEPSERFLAQVMDGIHMRQAGANAVELGWWGMTRLVLELMESMLHAIGVHGDIDRKE